MNMKTTNMLHLQRALEVVSVSTPHTQKQSKMLLPVASVAWSPSGPLLHFSGIPGYLVFHEIKNLTLKDPRCPLYLKLFAVS